MTTARHPVRVEFDGIEAIFTLAAIRKDIAAMEKRQRTIAALRGDKPPTDSQVVDLFVIRALRNAAEKLDRATYAADLQRETA